MSRLRTTIEEDTDLAKQSEGTRLGVGSRKSFIESYKYEEMRHLDERRLFPMPKAGRNTSQATDSGRSESATSSSF